MNKKCALIVSLIALCFTTMQAYSHQNVPRNALVREMCNNDGYVDGLWSQYNCNNRRNSNDCKNIVDIRSIFQQGYNHHNRTAFKTICRNARNAANATPFRAAVRAEHRNGFREGRTTRWQEFFGE